MPALGFLETATNPSVWEADRLFIQMPSVLAGVSRACCHASEGTASPQPLLSLLRRDVCMTDVTSAGYHGDKIISRASRCTQSVPSKRRQQVLHRILCICSFVSKSHNSGHCTDGKAQGDMPLGRWSLEIQRPYL